jgi:outer membrane lipoprotein carrier protein
MRILRSLVCIAMFISAYAWCAEAQAQTKAFECSASGAIAVPQALAILDKVQAQYVGIDSMQGSFTQSSYVAALDEGEDSSGEMIFAKPGRMRWSYKNPREQEVVIRDQELWMYQPDKGQVMIDDIRQVLLSALPISFMMGIGNLAKDFDLSSACHSPEGTVLRLVPHKKEAAAGQGDELSGFDLLVDPVKNVPIGAKIASLGGNTTAILFKNLQLKVDSLPPGTFVLEYPKGVDVLDRRIKAGS